MHIVAISDIPDIRQARYPPISARYLGGCPIWPDIVIIDFCPIFARCLPDIPILARYWLIWAEFGLNWAKLGWIGAELGLKIGFCRVPLGNWAHTMTSTNPAGSKALYFFTKLLKTDPTTTVHTVRYFTCKIWYRSEDSTTFAAYFQRKLAWYGPEIGVIQAMLEGFCAPSSHIWYKTVWQVLVSMWSGR